MGKAVKIAISLPAEVLAAAEQQRMARGQTRSEFFCRAVEAFLRQEQERVAVEQYVQAYRRWAETDDEVRAAERAAQEVFVREPWE